MKALERVLSECLAKSNAPAIGAAVLLGGELAELDVVGIRKRGKSVQAERSDNFHLGHCAIAMTATLTARLIDVGKLSWDTRVTDIFNHLVIHEDYKDITLKQVLNHRVGPLPKVDEDLWQQLGTKSASEQRLALVTNILKRPFMHASEYNFSYADPNYLLGGVMLETVTLESFESLVAKELFEPLGMTSAGFGAPAKSGVLEQPFGHNPDPVDPLLYGGDPKALSPVGITHCSLKDWASFARLHLTRQPKNFISSKSFEHLHPNLASERHAMGWTIGKHSKAGHVLWQGSGNTMFFAMMCLYPEIKTGLLVVSNLGGQLGEETCLTTMLQLERNYV